MNTPELTLIPVQNLEIFAGDRDILQDLWIYLNYVSEHKIKRMVRSNKIPKSDSMKLARLMGDSELEEAVKETGGAGCISILGRVEDGMPQAIKLLS